MSTIPTAKSPADARKTYLDKEKELISAIMKSDKDTEFKKMACDMIGDALSRFPEYVNTVVTYQVQMPLIYAHYDGQELRDRVTELDMSRHNAHECAISSVDQLNRLCGQFGLEPFSTVDTTNRTAVADFAGEFVNETYNNAIGGTMDSLTLGKRDNYDPKKTKHRVDQMAEAMMPDFTGAGEGPEFGD